MWRQPPDEKKSAAVPTLPKPSPQPRDNISLFYLSFFLVVFFISLLFLDLADRAIYSAKCTLHLHLKLRVPSGIKLKFLPGARHAYCFWPSCHLSVLFVFPFFLLVMCIFNVHIRRMPTSLYLCPVQSLLGCGLGLSGLFPSLECVKIDRMLPCGVGRLQKGSGFCLASSLALRMAVLREASCPVNCPRESTGLSHCSKSS